MKNKINGNEVSPFKAEEHEGLSQLCANLVNFFVFLGVCTIVSFVAFFMYNVDEAKVTFNDIKEIETTWEVHSVDMPEVYKSERASYAYEYSGYNKDFVLTLNAENGAWTHDQRHGKAYLLCWTLDQWVYGVLPNQAECIKNNKLEREMPPEDRLTFWRTHYDWGLCGTSDGYKSKVFNDERFFTDWKWQIRECYRMYKGGTRFYGYDKRHDRGYMVRFNKSKLQF